MKSLPSTRSVRQFVTAALCGIGAYTITACSRPKDPALQEALEQLTRLSSYTDTGLNYSEYSDRLLTAKANIEVALQQTNDQRAKEKIERAVSFHVEARNEWRRKIDDKYYSGDGVQPFWLEATAATRLAAEYAFATNAMRRKIDAREEAARKEKARRLAEEAKEIEQQLQAERQAEAERQAKESEAEKNRKAQLAEAEAHRQAKVAENEQKRREAEAKRIAEEAERERIRRFAPEGTAFNVQPITVTMKDGLATIPPGTELKVTRKDSDGTLQVTHGELSATVQATVLTNDRDLADAIRTDDKAKLEAIRQWQAQQAAAAAEQERQKHLQSERQSTAPYTYPVFDAQPRYVNPLDRGAYK